MKKILLALLFLLPLFGRLEAQELYVNTEPASNMPKNSIGLRLSNEGVFGNDFKNRFIPEVMVGLNKNLMMHVGGYVSDFYQSRQKIEGYSLYAKYRFLSIDSVQRHFRAAVFARYADIRNPLLNQEINLEGDNSGIQGGVVFTQLLHKLALSGSVGYIKAFDNRAGNRLLTGQPDGSISYTFSGGYLVAPRVYESYDQPNLNVYVELLGKTNTGSRQNFMDAAPALQLILNSKMRIDLSRRFQLWGNMSRSTKNMYLVRLEYNLFNVF